MVEVNKQRKENVFKKSTQKENKLLEKTRKESLTKRKIEKRKNFFITLIGIILTIIILLFLKVNFEDDVKTLIG